jgi:hypothetical protein
MAFETGELWIPEWVDKPYTAEVELADRIAVIYGTSEGQVDVPEYRGQQCAGITKVEQDTVYAANDTRVSLFKKGLIRYTAGDAHAVGTPLSIYNTSGHLGTARDGDFVVGIAIRTVGTAADYGLVDLNISGLRESRVQIIPSLTMTDDTTLYLNNVAGDYSVELFFEETAGNAVTGGLDVGTTAGGSEVASAITCSGSTKYHAFNDATTVAVAAAFHTLTANDIFYITAASAWNSASVDMYVKLTRLS